jgi:predicted DNA-binding transcriptional regulator AlpA
MTQSKRLKADLLTIYEVAALLECSISTIYSYDARGVIPAPIQFAGRNRWELSKLHDWAAAGFPRRELQQEQRKAKA